MINSDSPLQDRPLLLERLRRAEVDWGDAPKYTKEYRQIRWPGRPPETITHTVDGRVVTQRIAAKPNWMSSMEYERRTKRLGSWNELRTRSRLHWDIKFCMQENIPIKTKTFEYKPSDQWLYVKGKRVLKYDLFTGCLTQFTYSGTYDKVVSLLLRLFKIKVKLEGRKLMWHITDHEGHIEINLNMIYDLRSYYDRILYIRYYMIDRELYREYLRTSFQLQ